MTGSSYLGPTCYGTYVSERYLFLEMRFFTQHEISYCLYKGSAFLFAPGLANRLVLLCLQKLVFYAENKSNLVRLHSFNGSSNYFDQLTQV